MTNALTPKQSALAVNPGCAIPAARNSQISGLPTKKRCCPIPSGSTSPLQCRSLWELFKLNRTLPGKLSPLAAKTLQTFASSDTQIFTALHTFGRRLNWNVHIHLPVTRGGLYDDSQTERNTLKITFPDLLKQTFDSIHRNAYSVRLK